MDFLSQIGRLAITGLFLCVSVQAGTAASYTTLYNFHGGKDGAQPFGALVRDPAGNLYGTTGSGGRSQGVIYRLGKPAAVGDAWQERVLYMFRGGAADGSNPDGALAIGQDGALYGTTQSGGYGKDDGTVFRLAPPRAGQTAWTETVLHKFGPTEGANPVAGLVIGADGTLYGTTCGCGAGDFSEGTVFAVFPPPAGAIKWTYRVLHRFSGGADGGHSHAPLTMGAQSVLYGTASAGGTHNAGTIFTLTPPKAGVGNWTFTTLYSFTGGPDGAYPNAGIAIDPARNILFTSVQYGGNGSFGNGNGTVIELTPPGQSGGDWAERTLHVFNGTSGGSQPGSTPVLGADGTIFGTTELGGNDTICSTPEPPSGCGTVYALHPPAPGATKWQESVLHQFDARDGNVPWAALTLNGAVLYGATEIGGPADAGTVFEIKP